MKIFLYIKQHLPLLFLPFLFLYILIIYFSQPPEFVGDEPRYLLFAHNLLNGYYSPPLPEINLWNGPGYPAVIAVPLYFNLPEMYLRYINAFWMYASLILIFKTIKQLTNKRIALIFSILAGLYYPIYRVIPLIFTETFTWFLISLITYLFVKYFDAKTITKKQILFLSLALMYLILTKVIFAYVALVMLIISVVLYFIKPNKSIYKRSLQVFLFALVLNIPYIIYTHSLTGKWFYWSNAGSLSLYTMSTPYPDENGGFMTPLYLVTSKNHQKEADSIINKMTALPMDEALQKVAIQNIKKHPNKYFKNWLSNLSRLFFEYPQFRQKFDIKRLLMMFPGLIIILSMLYSFWVIYRKKIKLPASFVVLLTTFMIYFGGSSLLSAFLRMFYISIPFFTIWLAFVYDETRNIKIGQQSK